MEAATTTQLLPPSRPLFDEARLAVGGFLARYAGNTRAGYACDLRAWLASCAQLASRCSPSAAPTSNATPAGWRRKSTSPEPPIGRRLSTVIGFYRYAVIDGYLSESPAEHVRRPKIDTESTTLGLDRMELGAFLAQAAAAGPVDHALACLLGLLGLRVSDTCGTDADHHGRAGPPHGHRGGERGQGGGDPVPAAGRQRY